MDYEVTRYETPVPDDLIQEIWAMWLKVPEQVGMGPDISRLSGQLTNSEQADDRKLLYVARVDGRVAGTSMIWISGRDATMCEFGLPATSPEFRRRGIGQALFDQPVSDFREMGGEAMFLGTNHLPAGRVYYRAGYRKLVGSITLINILSGESPEAYFVDYFRDLGLATVHPGHPTDRTSAIPLVHSPHDWQVMDCNVPTESRRYFVHHGFSGKAGQYVAMLNDPKSTFFAARAGGRQRVVGLSTALFVGDGVCSVDGFTHQYYKDQWSELIESAMSWAKERDADQLITTLSAEDYEKKDLFESLGFKQNGEEGEFYLDGVHLREYPEGRPVAAIKMEIF